MHVVVRHRWALTIEAARRVQQRLAGEVRRTALPLSRVRVVAGCDVAVARGDARAVAAVVVMTLPGLEVIETHTAVAPLRFPYVPGYLSFREIPVLVRCLRRVRARVDAILCDGQGIAHPRRFGLAAHLGVLTGVPTVGCAKSRLCGEHDAPGPRRGDWTPLRLDGETVGCVLRTRDDVRPLFVSPGHRVDVASARRLVLACGAGYRLPEPTRRADAVAGAARRRVRASGSQRAPTRSGAVRGRRP